LARHPQADDIVLLLKWRDEMWTKLTKKEQGAWAAFWSWTYHNKYPLKQKHLTKLETITIQATDRHLKSLVIKAEQKQKIRQLRSVI
jgi:hypothetical protein